MKSTLAKGMHAAGLTFLVRWSEESPQWQTANGIRRADDVSVIAAANAGDGVFVAWRTSKDNPRAALPVVFRLTPNGETVCSFEIIVREPDGSETVRTTVSAIDESEAVRVAMLAGHVFTDLAPHVHAIRVPMPADKYRLCLIIGPEWTHGGAVMDWATGEQLSREWGLLTHPDVIRTAGVRFRFNTARGMRDQERPGAVSRGSFMETECAEWRYVLEIRCIEPETLAFLAALKLPPDWSIVFP